MAVDVRRARELVALIEQAGRNGAPEERVDELFGDFRESIGLPRESVPVLQWHARGRAIDWRPPRPTLAEWIAGLR